MQQRLGVATGLRQTLEDQVTGGLVAHRGVKVASHRLVQRVASVLGVDHGGHALKSFLDLGGGHHAMMQPVGHVLAGDAQRGTVFHQRYVVDVRHLGAAHALVVVVEFLLELACDR